MIGIEVYENPNHCSAHENGLQTGPCYCNTEWRFRVRALNGEILAASEGYTTKASAEKGIRALRRALLPGTRQTDREQAAESWQRGFLFAYYQERGWDPGAAEKKSQAAPTPWLQEHCDERNPYRDGANIRLQEPPAGEA